MFSSDALPLNRRELLQGLAASTALAATGGMPLLADGKADRELIRLENEKPGTTAWQLTYTRIDPKTKCTRFGGGIGGGRSTMVEGYVSRASVRAGDKLDMFLSADPASPIVVDIYRLGYYQGKGGRH